MTPQLQEVLGRLNDAPLSDITDLMSEALSLVESTPEEEMNAVAFIGLMVSAVYQNLNRNLVGLDQQVANAHLVPAIVNVLSGGLLRTVPAVSPLDDYNQVVAGTRQSMVITLARRIKLSKCAQQLLDEDRGEANPRTIRERHRLEMWACGLVPPDLINLLDPISVYEGRVLALPRWNIEQVGNNQLLTITQLPHAWWENIDALKLEIAAALSWTFQSGNGQPTEEEITRAIFEALLRSVGCENIRIDLADPERVDPLVGLSFTINQLGLVVCPSVDVPVPSPSGVEAAAERQAELLGDAIPPAIDVAALHPFGHGLEEAQHRQQQLLSDKSNVHIQNGNV